MTLKVINTLGGLDTDTAINKYPNNRYYDAQNVRLISNDRLSSGLLSSVKAPGVSITPLITLADGVIIGSCLVRETIVIFVTQTTGNKYSAIYKRDIDDITYTLVYSDATSSDGTKLNFNVNNPIKAVGRYESEDVQKVYWCDGLNQNGFINIATTYTTESATLFTLTPQATLKSPQPYEVTTGGTLKSGTIYYTYQLYRSYGNITSMSSSSFGIPLSSKLNNELNNFRGDEQGINTGNAVKIRFQDLDTSFDRIKIYSIHFADLDGDPIINLIADQQFNTTSLIYIDSGSISLELLSVSEFIMSGGRIFSSKTLESHYNYLFAGNITEVFRDIDFDARAYRPGYGTSTSQVFNNEYGYQTIINIDTSNGDWSEYPYGGGPTLRSGSNWTIPEKADCIALINSYNGIGWGGYPYASDLELSTSCVGPNIEVSHCSVRTEENSWYPVRPDDGLYSDLGFNQLRYIQPVYKYASLLTPIVAGKYRGYKRNEVYRLGIEFHFKNGQKSFVKWICDYRLPTMNSFDTGSSNEDHCQLTKSTGVTVDNSIGCYQKGIKVKVDLSSLDADTYNSLAGFKIVRCERKEEDKNVLHQGIISSAFTLAGIHEIFPTRLAIKADYDSGVLSSVTYPPIDGSLPIPFYPINTRIFEYISPDISLNDSTSDYVNGDVLYSGVLYNENYLSAKIPSSPTSLTAYKRDTYFSPYISSSYHPNYKIHSVNNAFKLDVKYASGLLAQYVYDTFIIYNKITNPYNSPSGTGFEGSKMSGLILDLDFDGIQSYSVDNADIIICDYLRPRGGTSYGGNTYSARKINSYIPTLCGLYSEIDNQTIGSSVYNDMFELVTLDKLDVNKQVELAVYGGDTYTCFFDTIRSYAKHPNAGTGIVYDPAKLPIQHYLSFPVESSSNLNYRRDEILKYYNENSLDGVYKLQEDLSVGLQYYPLNYPVEATDLYLYNRSYSRNNNITNNTEEPDNFINTNVFDTMITASDKKFNNEIIDSWTRYRFNKFLEVDSEYGPLNVLKKYNNQLYYFQDNAFGIVAVEDRSAITDNSGKPLTLGTGEVLERYDYISNKLGCVSNNHIVNTSNNLYYIDYNNKSLNVISKDDSGNISKLKKISNLVTTLIDTNNSRNCIIAYNPEHKEVWFTLGNDTVMFSELMNEFVSRLSIVYGSTVSNKLGIYTCTSVNNKLVLHNISKNITNDTIVTDYLADSVVTGASLGNLTELTLIIHPQADDTFTFDNLDIRTNVYQTYSKNVGTDIEILDDTLHEIGYSNSYTSETVQTLNPGTTSTLISRLLRSWRVRIPLIAPTGNRLSSSRFIDNYIKVRLKFNNGSKGNWKILLHDIISYIRPVNSAKINR
jgi:hypothetical protein